MSLTIMDKETDNKEAKRHLPTRKSIQRRILENALLEKYDSTALLAGKLLWPALCFLIGLMFYSDISKLIQQLSLNLARTSKITIAGVEIEIYADSLRGSDFEAYAILGKLNREELLYVLDLGESIRQIDSSNITLDDREQVKSLKDKGILLVDEGAISSVDNTKTVVEISLTDLGERVHRELQSILINFVKSLPEEQQVQP